jgi:hypothetical protein
LRNQQVRTITAGQRLIKRIARKGRLPTIGREHGGGEHHPLWVGQQSGSHENGIANAMRILLQQVQSGLYLKAPAEWVANPAEATDFLSSTKALAFCAAHRISGVQLVLKFEREHYEIVLPLRRAQSQRATA